MLSSVSQTVVVVFATSTIINKV